jgi:hypothetical protein
VDVLRRAEAPMTAREIADALVADKATQKQAIDLQAANRRARHGFLSKLLQN